MERLHPAYLTERSRLELTLRLIAVEARTRTIKQCTGLSDDRIRKIYSRYFKSRSGSAVKRRRGKSPRQVAHFVKNSEQQIQATTLFYLFCATGLLRLDTNNKVHSCWPQPDVEYGHRLCRAFDTYKLVHPTAVYNFEWTWALLQSVSRFDELGLSRCGDCALPYIHDCYAIDFKRCPACEIRLDIGRRPGLNRFS